MDPNYYNTTPNSDSPSSSSEECSVCLEKVHKVDMYAKIDSDNEADKKYHPYCLNKWFSLSTLGLISREDVDSYSIYSADVSVDQVAITGQNNDRDHPDHIDQDHPDEHAVLINDNANEEPVDTYNENQSNNSKNIVLKIVVPFAICVIISILAYFMFQ